MPRSSRKNQTVGYVALGLLVALLGFTWLTGRRGAPPAAAAAGPLPAASTSAPAQGAPLEGSPAPGPSRPPSGSGEVTAVMDDVVLSPQARLLAERFQCVCGCEMILAECTCDKTPGSHDMKRHLQSLVDAGKSPAEVEGGMIDRYGRAVLP